MADQSFTIPGQLPTLNAVLAATKRHWSAYATVKKTETAKVHWIAKGQLNPITPPSTWSLAGPPKTAAWTSTTYPTDKNTLSTASSMPTYYPTIPVRPLPPYSTNSPPPDAKSPRVTIEIIEVHEEKKTTTKARPLEKGEQF